MLTINKKEKEYKRACKLMGNNFEITVVAISTETADEAIDLAVNEIRRIETLLTTFRDDSQVNEVNRNAGIRPVLVDGELIALVLRARRISELTDGAFDITYGSIDKRLWNFDRTMNALPDEQTASKMVRLINYRNVIVDRDASTIFLKEAGMRIGFGGIGKGYAAERAKAILKDHGINSGIVNASGDLCTWGMQANGKPWTIGIGHPEFAGQPFSSLEVSEMAVATSGNYEKYIMIDGKRYSHTINPKTGLPVTGIKSVTIICPNAEIADALATPVTVMGTRAGLAMINQLKGVECIIIDDYNQIYTSKQINLA
jgi:thiamine biosynthesis lipoprotein